MAFTAEIHRQFKPTKALEKSPQKSRRQSRNIIVYTHSAARELKPMDSRTLEIESKLGTLEISADRKIQGVISLGSKVNGHVANSCLIKICNKVLVIHPEGTDTIVVDEIK